MPTDRRALPPKCPICGYYLTTSATYAGYRCADERHWQAAGADVDRLQNERLRRLAIQTGSRALTLAWGYAELDRQCRQVQYETGGEQEIPF